MLLRLRAIDLGAHAPLDDRVHELEVARVERQGQVHAGCPPVVTTSLE